jgi:excisionase family DNA binding protein
MSEDLFQQYLSLPVVQREKEFVSTARAAKCVGVSRRTVQYWVQTGKVKAIFIGRKCKVHIKSLLDYVQSGVDGQ